MKNKTIQSLIVLGSMLCIPLNLLTTPLAKEARVNRACECPPPEQGPQGPPGPNNFLDTFGSFYTLFDENATINIIPIDQINSNVNITNNPPFEVLIQKSGVYYIQYGVCHNFNGFFDPSGIVALFKNGLPVPGTTLYLLSPCLVTMGIIVPLSANDVLTIQGQANLQQFAPDQPVSAYIDLIKIGS